MTNDPIIKIEQLEKSFGDLHVLKGIDLEVNRGEVVCIIGASGSGKSTLLRCINLLEEADSGHIWFDGQDLMDLKVNLNALRQKIGMVFQGFNLIRNLTALENVELPLIYRNLSGMFVPANVQAVFTCDALVIGMIPGMIGTVIPFSLTR